MKIETQSTRSLKVLSIDFDYFQNVDADTIRSCYPDGIDLPTELSTIVWSGYYANDRTRNKLSSVTILNDELNLLRKLLTSKDNFRVSTPVLITNSHVHIYDFIHEYMDKYEVTDVNIVNIDMHHDFFNKNKELDCGNWLSHIYNDYLNHCNVSWITNPVSNICYDFDQALNNLVKNSIQSIKDFKFDILFLCRSDNWLAPHLDYHFDNLVKLISLRFPNVCIEKSVQTPRDIQSIANNIRKAYLTQSQS